MSLKSLTPTTSSLHNRSTPVNGATLTSTRGLQKAISEQKAKFSRLEKWEFTHYRERGFLGWVAKLILLMMPSLKSRFDELERLEIALKLLISKATTLEATTLKAEVKPAEDLLERVNPIPAPLKSTQLAAYPTPAQTAPVLCPPSTLVISQAATTAIFHPSLLEAPILMATPPCPKALSKQPPSKKWGGKAPVLSAVKAKGCNLQYASPKFRGDKQIVLTALSQDGLALKYASSELQANKEVVLAAIKQKGESLQYASFELRCNKEIVMVAVQQSALALAYASISLRTDRDVIAAAINLHAQASNCASPEGQTPSTAIFQVSPLELPATNLVSTPLSCDVMACNVAKPLTCQVQELVLPTDTEVASESKTAAAPISLPASPSVLPHSPVELPVTDLPSQLLPQKLSEESLSAEIQKKTDLLLQRQSSGVLKGQMKSVIEQQDSNAKKESVISLMNSLEDLDAIIQGFSTKAPVLLGGGGDSLGEGISPQALPTQALTVMKNQVTTTQANHKPALDLASLPYSLKCDKAFMLAAIAVDGMALKWVSPSLLADKEVVLAAVTQNGAALQFASEEFKLDKEVVLAAVTQNIMALQFTTLKCSVPLKSGPYSFSFMQP